MTVFYLDMDGFNPPEIVSSEQQVFFSCDFSAANTVIVYKCTCF